MPAVDVDVEALSFESQIHNCFLGFVFFFPHSLKFTINSLAGLCLSKNSHSKTLKKGNLIEILGLSCNFSRYAAILFCFCQIIEF